MFRLQREPMFCTMDEVEEKGEEEKEKKKLRGLGEH